MTREELENTSIYNTLLKTFKLATQADEEYVKTNLMPHIMFLIENFYNVEGVIKKVFETTNQPIIVQSDSFVKEYFVDKACKWLEEQTRLYYNGSEYHVASKEKINVQEFIDNFKQAME